VACIRRTSANLGRTGKCIPEVLEFDDQAAMEFQRLRKLVAQVGTMDLKIAAIVLTQGAKLLSRNLVDFRKIPNLDVEDWTT
jgi:tRNA(fMet)-specific endonuclease VapC